MLVLARQRDESITIGDGDDEVEIKIVDIRGDKVRLGITARRDIPVHRKEVRDAIDAGIPHPNPEKREEGSNA